MVLLNLLQEGTIFGIDINLLLTLLGPPVVMAATWLVTKIKVIPGKYIVWLVVPLISGVIAVIAELLEVGTASIVVQFVLNLSATFFHQLRAQLKPANQ